MKNWKQYTVCRDETPTCCKLLTESVYSDDHNMHNFSEKIKVCKQN